jgi:HEAT repeat protein
MLRSHERSGVPLASALRSVMLDPGADWLVQRGTAARFLALADSRMVVARLLDLFFTQTDKRELWDTALTIEHCGDRSAVPRLIEALHDANPYRRHAAARALGWIPRTGRRAAKALIRALVDTAQPQPVREEAAESLAYSNYAPAIPALISVLGDPDVRLRFWAVFGLGSVAQSQAFAGRASLRAIEALEGMLSDEAVPPGNWWSVGKEALAMLSGLDSAYESKLREGIKRVVDDANASAEDRRWADFYG